METRAERAAGFRIIFYPSDGDPVELLAPPKSEKAQSQAFGINLNLQENKLFKARQESSPKNSSSSPTTFDQVREVETPQTNINGTPSEILSKSFLSNPSWDNVKMPSIPEEA